MSSSANKSRAKSTSSLKAAQALTATNKRLDGWSNILTGAGTNRDPVVRARFSHGIVDYTRQEIDELYVGDDVAGRIIDFFPEEMTRAGFDILEDDKGALSDVIEQIGFLSYVEKALVEARMYGTSLLIMGADDGRRLRSPLIESRVRRFDWFAVKNRFDLRVARYYTDPTSSKYGQPEIYEIDSYVSLNDYEETNQTEILGYGTKIHESRVIRFDGTRTPDEVKEHLQGFSLGVLNRLYEPVRAFQVICSALAVIPTNFSQAYLKIKGLAGMLSADNDDLVKKRLALLDESRSILNLVPLDAENEEFGRSTMSMTGVGEVFDRFANKLSLATGIPKSILIGEAQGGLNASGESDHRIVNNRIESMQKNILKGPITKAINMIARARGIKPANGSSLFTIKFRPLLTPSAKEVADERKLVAETDRIMIESKVVTPKEVATSRYHNGYSSEMILDTEARKLNDSNDARLATNGQPLDIEKISGIVQQIASGAIPMKAGSNILTTLYQVPKETVAELLDGVEPLPPPQPAGSVNTGSTTDKPNAAPRSAERGPAKKP